MKVKKPNIHIEYVGVRYVAKVAPHSGGYLAGMPLRVRSLPIYKR